MPKNRGQALVATLLLRAGSDLAYTIGTERVEVILAGQQVRLKHRVTNIYRREAEGWKMVHHRTDLSPALRDILSRSQPPSAYAGN
jgi:ketosteroid isomerase-like protein